MTVPVIKPIGPPSATLHSDLRSSQPSEGCLGNVDGVLLSPARAREARISQEAGRANAAIRD
jgi:hypothetical protein